MKMDKVISYIAEIQDGHHLSAPKNSHYPREASLIDKMPPIYNQAQRGTCVANSVTALVECFEDCKSRLSVQFLYQLTKDLEVVWYARNVKALAEGKEPDAEFRYFHASALTREKWNYRAAKIEALRRVKADGDFLTVEEQSFVNTLSQEELGLLNQRAIESLTPEFDSGTMLHHAFATLDKFGICRYELCPYSRIHVRESLAKATGAADFTEEVYKDARKHRVVSGDLYVLPTPNNLDEIKGILTGANQRRPMPVSVGVSVFSSLCGGGKATEDADGYRVIELPSVVYLTNGKKNENGEYVITGMELGEKSSGGHEMLIVGYKDEDGWAGGGYFLVRNSWGEDWGTEGYCKIPYAYIECFCTEAGTILQNLCDYKGDGSYKKCEPDTPQDPLAKIPDNLKPYARVADKDMKDRFGIFSIAKGMIILVDANGTADRDTVDNRAVFVGNGYSWKVRAIQTVNEKSPFEQAALFGDETDADEEASSSAGAVDAATVVQHEFFAHLDYNLFKKSKSYCFPNINLSAMARFVPWQIRVKNIALCDDLSEQLASAFVKDGLIKEADRALASKCNGCKIYKLSNGKTCFYVAAVFVSPVRNGAITTELSPDYYTCVKTLLDGYYDYINAASASCRFLVVGSSARWQPAIPASLGRDSAVLFCQKSDADAAWRIDLPDVRGGAVWYGFVRHLLPLTEAQRLAALKTVIRDIQLEDGGHITLAKLSERLHLPPRLVLGDLDLLCREGGWAYAAGILREDKKRKPGKGIVSIRDNLVFGYWNNFASAFFFAVGWKLLVRPDMSNRYHLLTIAGLALFSYLGSLLSAENLRKVVGVGKE